MENPTGFQKLEKTPADRSVLAKMLDHLRTDDLVEMGRGKVERVEVFLAKVKPLSRNAPLVIEEGGCLFDLGLAE
jgi:hypothetical protein